MELVERIVEYSDYCRKCKHLDKPEYKDPCNECLENPVNINTTAPVKYEPRTNYKSYNET